MVPIASLDTVLAPSDNAVERPAPPIGARLEVRGSASFEAEALEETSTSEPPQRRHGVDGFHGFRMLAAAMAATTRVRTTAAATRTALREWITVYLGEPDCREIAKNRSNPGRRLSHLTAIRYGAARENARSAGKRSRKHPVHYWEPACPARAVRVLKN